MLQRPLNAALSGHLPQALGRQRQRLAIDLTLLSDHGKTCHDVDEVYRAPAKDGSSHFHAYAIASIVRKGQRYTMSPMGRAKGEPLKGVVQRLLQQAASVGIRSCLLLLDRGFYNVAVVRYLQAARSPFLMPVVCHGGSSKERGGPSGSDIVRTWKRPLVNVHPHPCEVADAGHGGDGSYPSVLPCDQGAISGEQDVRVGSRHPTPWSSDIVSSIRESTECRRHVVYRDIHPSLAQLLRLASANPGRVDRDGLIDSLLRTDDGPPARLAGERDPVWSRNETTCRVMPDRRGSFLRVPTPTRPTQTRASRS